MNHRICHIAIFLTLLFALASGCGRKGPVRPLKQPLPSAPKKLAVMQKGERFLLQWNIPQTNQNGTPLTDLQGFRVYQMKYDPADDCPDCRDTSVLLQQVELDYLRNAFRSKNHLYLWVSGLAPGAGYQYRVVPFNRKNRDGAAIKKRLPFIIPPQPPGSVTATGHDQMVRLTWEPAEQSREDVKITGYNVYRRSRDEAFPPQPLHRTPLTENSFEDFGLENGRTYIYAVRSSSSTNGVVAESAASEAIEVTPKAGQ